MLNHEIENVLKNDISKQYEYFIKKVADYEQVWSIRANNGWATLGEGERKFFPVWPRKEFADICLNGEWENYYCESIELEEFIDDWISGLKEDNIRITVMWNNGNGIDVDWDTLKQDIEQELENY